MTFKDWWKEKPYLSKGFVIGSFIGIILAILNLFSVGMLGFIFLYPLRFLPVSLNNFIQYSIFNCSGEDCWMPMIILGSIWMLILSIGIGTLIGWIIGKIKSK